VDWIDLAQDRNTYKWRDLVNKARDKILGFIKYEEFIDFLGGGGDYHRVNNSERRYYY
jgi:hypothetical protein